MATRKGSAGIVRANVDNATNNIAEIRSYSLTTTGDTLDDTSMGDTSRTTLPSLTSFSGSVDCFWDETNTNGQMLLIVGNVVTMRFYPEGSPGTLYSGDGIITGLTINASFDGMVEASFTFQGTGALTRTIVA
jgi:hypothetical protein